MLRHHVRSLLIAGLCLIALTAASVPVLNLTAYTPERTVIAYLSDMGRGDAERALGRLVLPNIADVQALTDDALSGAQSLPARPRVASSEVSEDGSLATVVAEYDLSGETQQTTFELERRPAQWGLYEQWAIRVPTLPIIRFDVEGSSAVKLNGAPIVLTSSALPVLYPAEYSVGLSAKHFRSAVARVPVVAPGEEVEAQLRAEPTEELRADVEEQAAAHLDACAEATTLMPAGCTFGYETSNEIIGDVAWEMQSYPDIVLVQERNRLVTRPTRAVAVVSGTYRDAVTAEVSDFREEVEFTFSAAVEARSERVTITPLGASLAGER